MKRTFQPAAALAHEADRGAEIGHQPHDPRFVASPYLTMAEAARYLRFDVTSPVDPERACREWLKRQLVPVKRRGRVLLVERRVLEAVMVSA